MKLSILVLFCCLTLSASAMPPAIDGEFTLKSGPYAVEISGKQKFCIFRVKYEDFIIGANSGFYGSILATDKGKFIGSGHTEGGEEKVETLEILADGKSASPSKDAVISADKIEFHKVSMQDNLRVYTDMIINAEGIRIDKHFEATASQKIYSFYIFQYCWTPETSEWMIGRPDGSTASGEFKSNDGWHLRNERELIWYSLYAQDARIGMMGYFSRYSPGQGSYMFWDKKIYHKFYFTAALPKLVENGYKSPQYSMLLKGFRAEPDAWKDEAGKLAVGLMKEFPPPLSLSGVKCDFENNEAGTSEEAPFGGKKCLELKGNGVFACKKIPLPLEKNQKYQISFAVRKGLKTSDKPASNYALVGQYDEEKKFHTFGTYAGDVSRDGQWHEVKGTFQAPDKLFDCNLYIYNKNSDDSIYVDDIIVEKVNQQN